MIIDWHYWVYVYFTPFIIYFGVIFALLSRIFPDQRKSSVLIAMSMGVLGTLYIVRTGLAESFFLSFVGKSVEIIGFGGMLVFLFAIMGIRLSGLAKNDFVKLGLLMLFSLIMLWILEGTKFEDISSSVFGLIFLFCFFGFAYLISRKKEKSVK